MHDRANALLGEDAVDELAISDIAFVERQVVGNDIARSCRKIVDHCDRPARIAKSEDGVAANVAGAAGHEHRKLTHGRALAEVRDLRQ